MIRKYLLKMVFTVEYIYTLYILILLFPLSVYNSKN